MSIMCCEVGDHNFDSDEVESQTLDKDIICCRYCFERQELSPSQEDFVLMRKNE